MRFPRLLALCAVLAGAACGDDGMTPTSPTGSTAVAFTTKLFSGTLAPRSTRFYSYTVRTSGTVTAMLASVVAGGSVPATSNRLELGIGIPAGTGCAVSLAENTAVALVPQLSQTASPGIYCVRVSDTDGLPGPMTFAVRITHP